MLYVYRLHVQCTTRCSQVVLMECDSHTLFRTVGSVKGAVVLLRAGASVPQPEMLATSLRGQRSLDDL